MLLPLLTVLPVLAVADPAPPLLLRSAYPTWQPIRAQGQPGDRLVLTKYLPRDADTARRLSLVQGPPFSEDTPSHAGYFTVDNKYNSNLFFWFFPAEEDYTEKPVILWLQGGPGSSSLFGLFTELGPFSVAEDNETLVPNPFSWHRNHSLIFIDNPIGTGFSFTDYDAGYATNMTQVGTHLYSALTQFFQVFSELQEVPFFIAGESFAGKYIPAIAYAIHKNNPDADVKINMEGIAIGNGFVDPVSFLDMSDFVYQLGLVDGHLRDAMKVTSGRGVAAIRAGNLTQAYSEWVRTLALFATNSDYTSLYNVLHQHTPAVGGNYADLVQRCDVRRALHVGDTEYTSVGRVYRKMIPQFMSSCRPWLEELIAHYRVLCYSGQLDVIVAYPMSVRMFDTLVFPDAQRYRRARRLPWYVADQLAGYVKSGGNFTEVLVRNAGHMVPTDQPEFALDLITRFVDDRLRPGALVVHKPQ